MTYICVMAATKIFFTDDEYQFILDYKEATGLSIQQFVSEAIKDKILKIETEQYLKDRELIIISNKD